jgi:hypothetical protein
MASDLRLRAAPFDGSVGMSISARAKRLAVKLRRRAIRRINSAAGVYGQKVFCVGRNKTGTTTMKELLTHYGYRLGPQAEAERFVWEDRWAMGPAFWEWVDRYEAFQDVPFSSSWFLPELYARYPDAKYVLTLRDPDDWFESIANHHYGKLGLPRDADPALVAHRLKADTYIAPGYLHGTHTRQFAIGSDDLLYDRAHYKQNLEEHNALVRRTIPADQLFELEIAKTRETGELCAFLGIPPILKRRMPWANRRR